MKHGWEPPAALILAVIAFVCAAAAAEAAARGEVVPGGCLVSGNEPEWLLVW